MRRSHGFSLIELLTTVAIVGILASIAVPSFAAMVAKSRQAEAKAGLNAIHALEVGYFAEASTFGSLADIGFVSEGSGRYGYLISSDSFVPPVLDLDTGGGTDPEGGGSFWMGGNETEFFGDDDDGGGGGTPGGEDLGGTPRGSELGYGTGNPHFSASSFEVVAVGVISGAPVPNDLDIWSIDHFNTLENINPGF